MQLTTPIATAANQNARNRWSQLRHNYRGQRRNRWVNLNLQQRDFAPFSVFLHSKAATSSQIYALCKDYFPSKFVFQRKLKQYVDAGFLAVPPEYRCLHWPQPGRPERIAMIGN